MATVDRGAPTAEWAANLPTALAGPISAVLQRRAIVWRRALQALPGAPQARRQAPQAVVRHTRHLRVQRTMDLQWLICKALNTKLAVAWTPCQAPSLLLLYTIHSTSVSGSATVKQDAPASPTRVERTEWALVPASSRWDESRLPAAILPMLLQSRSPRPYLLRRPRPRSVQDQSDRLDQASRLQVGQPTILLRTVRLLRWACRSPRASHLLRMPALRHPPL